MQSNILKPPMLLPLVPHVPGYVYSSMKSKVQALLNIMLF